MTHAMMACSPRTLDEASERVAEFSDPTQDVLVVSEDPAFIFDMQRSFETRGVRVLGCLGPAQGPCPLDANEGCPLAEHCSIVLVDSPPSGVFARHWKVVPVGEYASGLARRHHHPFVVLVGAPLGTSGASGEVAHVADRRDAIELVRWATVGRSAVHDLALSRRKGA